MTTSTSKLFQHFVLTLTTLGLFTTLTLFFLFSLVVGNVNKENKQTKYYFKLQVLNYANTIAQSLRLMKTIELLHVNSLPANQM